MNRRINITIFLVAVMLSSKATFSNERNSGLITLGGGIYNFMENGEKRCIRTNAADGTCFNEESIAESSMLFQAEILSNKKIVNFFKPKVGFLATDQEALYSYGGIAVDLFFGSCKCVVLSPSFSAGWYVDGNEIKLYNRLEFISGGDISYRFRNNVRIGVGIYHISNAGLGDENPGSELITFKYQIPF